MKRKTFYFSSLSLPYLVLILGAVVFFSVSAFIWGPLYTWMVVVLLFWSRGKNANEVRSMFLLSPVLLGCSMGIPALFVDLRSSAVLLIWGVLHVANLDSIMQTFLENNSIGEAFFIGVLWAFMVAISLIVGYVFVGIVLLIEKMLKQRGMFKTEEES